MRPRVGCVAMALMLLVPALGTTAELKREGAASAPEVSPAHLRQLVAQKQAMLGQMLGDSAATARIDASRNAQAQQSLAGARERYLKGMRELDSGNVGGANELFNEAILLLGIARRLAPDAAGRMEEERDRYARLLASIESLGRSYRIHLIHLARSESDDPGWRAVKQLVDTAKTHGSANRLVEANRLLLQAEYALLEAFGGVLRSNAIDYTPHFSDVRDEFQFEYERNQSYSELVPLAIAELKPSADATRLITRYMESSRKLRDQAFQLAGSRKFSEALASIRAGTEELQRALAAAGLVVPKEVSNP